MPKKSSPYTYVDRQGRLVDLSAWLDDPEWTKERVASLAAHKHRIHAMARDIDALRQSGYSRQEIMSIADWILSGRSLAGIS